MLYIDIASPNISSKIEIQLCEFPCSFEVVIYEKARDFNLNFENFGIFSN